MDAEQSKDMEAIVKMLLESERVAIQDMRNKLVGYDDATIGNIIWRARELVKDQHGIDFGPMRGEPGYIARRSPVQIAKYAVRQRTKGTRAHMRALGRMRLAASKTDDAKEKERLSRLAEREEERQNLRRKRAI